MENIIYNELLVRGYNVDVGVVENNVKNKDGKSEKKQLEVDFVCNLGNKRYCTKFLTKSLHSNIK